ncbi:Calcineurin-like phosphoesterase superfamily domain-containing protein [Sphingomonas gellani]|uniref:Calcineurin-like phosphoesterase superfamily domain-containing protein n=1 Tax=Sphingomonas gellani TaxID=1166340 RepID=A0A1H8D9M1_9SPHN|nr:metallophosphoesterase family protein [Sphingomonas gellani]SEN03187.1 Calcineurin-like phosphoesterase superfamily domain-containing protein [Sphingomonas gellani]
MKIAAISDIHGNLGALKAVLADAAEQRADLIVNLGDICSGGLQPAETAELLRGLAGEHAFTECERLKSAGRGWPVVIGGD